MIRQETINLILGKPGPTMPEHHTGVPVNSKFHVSPCQGGYQIYEQRAVTNQNPRGRCTWAFVNTTKDRCDIDIIMGLIEQRQSELRQQCNNARCDGGDAHKALMALK